MAEKQKYWITSIDGAKALVEGAEQRDHWTKVQGWTETADPRPGDRVWLEHEEHHGRQVFPAEAAPQWAGLGWHTSPPAEPVDLTKDPQLVDEQLPAPVPGLAISEPEKPAKTPAAAGEQSKEK
jgi:hypothetical protein